MRVPIACTLTVEGLADRIEEWRGFLAGSVAASVRTSGEQLRVQLTPSTTVLARAVDLAQREKACCAFFDFSIEIETDALWLSVRVPPGASSILDDLASLLPRVH
jgi:hypothetical protein